MANDLYLLIDFGSTYTKVLAIDMSNEKIIGRAQSPSTVRTDMVLGLQNALKLLEINGHPIDQQTFEHSKKIASSSAAGGLCVVAVGLIPDLTLEAAKKAALGAGAKVIGAYSYELDDKDVKNIEKSDCDVILLVGGTNGGNKEVIIHNARALATSNLCSPFVIAGNRAVSREVKAILELGCKYAEITENVLPELDRLNVEPARTCIRDIFMKRIVHSKGLDKAQDLIGDILMPTPMATLNAARLLADGSGQEPGLGELIVVEVGGATTNIHSVATGRKKEVFYKGLEEPYAKRTVEGDLGIRYNAQTILNIVGMPKLKNNISSINITESEIETHVAFISRNVNFIPRKEDEYLIDVGLANSAVEIAIERHVGYLEEVWGPGGVVKVQRGKDLTELKTIIGTGGIFCYNPYPERVLEAALYTKNNPLSLKPISPELFVDRKYMLYGIGLLSTTHPVEALRIAKKYLSKSINSSLRTNNLN